MKELPKQHPFTCACPECSQKKKAQTQEKLPEKQQVAWRNTLKGIVADRYE
jgi:hypothetical protein